MKGPQGTVSPDGHPNHEGQTAVRRRSSSSTMWCEEPITKRTIQVLEIELAGTENGPSLERLKRRYVAIWHGKATCWSTQNWFVTRVLYRFGLKPPVKRHLPYVTYQKPEPASNAVAAEPIFGKVARWKVGAPGPNCQLTSSRAGHKSHTRSGTPEGAKAPRGSLLDLLHPLELISSSGKTAVA